METDKVATSKLSDQDVALAEQEAKPKLSVKTLSDRVIPVELVAQIKSIGDVKGYLERHGVVSAQKQTLISCGRVLLDHEPVPAPDSVIHLFYYEPTALIADPIEAAADWDTKNRMKVFKGLYLFSIRKFHEAAPLLIDSLTTFSETSFMPFKDCVNYAAIASMLVLDRPTILKTLVKSPEVLEVINDLPHMEAYINSLYNCRYREFFLALGSLESEMKNDWLIEPHVQYIIKEMRIRAYTQIMQSYRSLTLESMAKSFGVTADFIDREVSRFIAAGRLNCVIDKVAGLVITSPPDQRNTEYVALIKQSDALAARMQKLGRILSY